MGRQQRRARGRKNIEERKKREDDGAGWDTVCRSAGTVGEPSTVVVGIATATAC